MISSLHLADQLMEHYQKNIFVYPLPDNHGKLAFDYKETRNLLTTTLVKH